MTVRGGMLRRGPARRVKRCSTECLDSRLCSHIRTTRQPSLIRRAFVVRSRRWLFANFTSQYDLDDLGGRPQVGQLCQKQPSMKRAIPLASKMKSGLPVTCGGCNRQPIIPWRTSCARIRFSVEAFPRDRMRLIMYDLVALLTVSIKRQLSRFLQPNRWYEHGTDSDRPCLLTPVPSHG